MADKKKMTLSGADIADIIDKISNGMKQSGYTGKEIIRTLHK